MTRRRTLLTALTGALLGFVLALAAVLLLLGAERDPASEVCRTAFAAFADGERTSGLRTLVRGCARQAYW